MNTTEFKEPTLTEAPKLISNQSTTTFLARQSKSLFKSTSPSHIAEMESFNYNYSTLPPDIARELKNTTTNIRVHYRNALQSISKVGQQLIKTKDMLPRGDWQEWVDKEFTQPGYFTIHTAQNYMNLARLVQVHGLENLKNLPLSVLYIVAREDEQHFVEHVLNQAKDGSITRTRYREIKKDYFEDQTPTQLTSPPKEEELAVNSVPTSAVVIDEPEQEQQEHPTISIAEPVKPTPESQPLEVTDITIEQEETVSYSLVSTIQTDSILYDYVFFSALNTNNYADILAKLNFSIAEQSLCFIYCSPIDLVKIIDCAQKVGLSYLTTLAISKDTSFRPDLNLSSNWFCCLVFYNHRLILFEDYLKDYYADNCSLIHSLIKSLPLYAKNSLIIDSLDSKSIFTEDILFLLGSNLNQYVYSN